MKNIRLAIIGSGPTALYLLKHISDNHFLLQNEIKSITIFEKENVMGMGMPYNPETTDKYNLSNISSEEIPELPQRFADWLRLQKKEQLKKWNITQFPIKDSEVYSRIALGHYFHEQYQLVLAQLKNSGFIINEFVNHKVIDVFAEKNKKTVQVFTSASQFYEFEKVVLSIGHRITTEDKPERGYYASPWPIKKLLPKKEVFFNFPIGTLGASLSAFDVVTSLAHRHGKFMRTATGLDFKINKKAKGFKIFLHSAEGWLPHLQYEQQKPLREIYRHTNRETLLSLIDLDGFLSIDVFFNQIARPALVTAFQKDKNPEIVKAIQNTTFHFKDFVALMSKKHEYVNSFIGMEKEKIVALDSIKNDKPIHWMETLDDLIYCLNYHAELLAAEDYLFLKKEIMPFQMNVIAALPLHSANILLALYKANCIDLIAGKVSLLDSAIADKKTFIQIKSANGTTDTLAYQMFINCAGQEKVDFENYPFPSMPRLGTVRKARAQFKKTVDSKLLQNPALAKTIFYQEKQAFLYTGGIDIGPSYKVIRDDGSAEPKIIDISFTHTLGCRPYSYGLQACNATSAIVVDSWISLDNKPSQTKTSIETITKLYQENEEL